MDIAFLHSLWQPATKKTFKVPTLLSTLLIIRTRSFRLPLVIIDSASGWAIEPSPFSPRHNFNGGVHAERCTKPMAKSLVIVGRSIHSTSFAPSRSPLWASHNALLSLKLLISLLFFTSQHYRPCQTYVTTSRSMVPRYQNTAEAQCRKHSLAGGSTFRVIGALPSGRLILLSRWCCQ
jgi:hypothetical protein